MVEPIDVGRRRVHDVRTALTLDGFYRRALPERLVPFASPEGRRLFQEALEAGGMEGYFALAEQFHTQSDPAFCGLGTLVMVLNALAIDPGRTWKGPWRWYSEELLDCCRPLDVVRERGITLDELGCLARCNGAAPRIFRGSSSTEEAFRQSVREASAVAGEPHLVVSYARSVLGQTGDGHFSPVAGYHRDRDLALVLDAARFKYPPHWVPVSLLWQAMLPLDPVTKQTRGYVMLRRGGTAPNPFFCRLALDRHTWPEVVQHLTGELPGALAAATPDSPRALVGHLFRLLPPDVASVLTTYPQPAIDAMPSDARVDLEALLAELRATELYAVTRDGLSDFATSTSTELATMLLLICPDATFAHVIPALRESLAKLRDLAAIAPRVRVELERLRTQIAALEDAHCGDG